MARLVRVREDSGVQLMLECKTGTKWTQLVALGYPVRVKRVLNKNYTHVVEVPYDAAQAATSMMEAGIQRMGITKGAAALLRAVQVGEDE